MASIERSKGKIRVRWRELPDPDGRRRERSRVCPSTTIARRLKADIEAAQALGRDWTPDADRPRRPGLEDLFAAYMVDQRRLLAQRTLVRYAHMLQAFVSWAAEQPHGAELQALQRQHLGSYWTYLLQPTGRHQRPRTKATARKHLEVIQLAWAWAWEHDEEQGWAGLIPRPRRLKMPRRETRPASAPSWAHMDAAVWACDHSLARPGRATAGAPAARDWLKRALMVFRFTGARIGAVTGLRWEDVDLDGAVAHILPSTTKGGYGGRTIPLSMHLVEYLAGLERVGDRVIGCPESVLNGRGHADRTIGRIWARAGVPDRYWKGQPTSAFRKGLRTGLTVAGVHNVVIDQLLGHGPGSVGQKHYLDPAALDPLLVAAVKLIPPIAEQRDA